MADSVSIATSGARGDRSRVLTGAVMKAREHLGLTKEQAAQVIGVSISTLSRLSQSGLQEGTKPFELGVLLVRVFRSLDAIVAGDEASMKSWMQTENAALHGRPIDLVGTTEGLVNVLHYLDARRAPI